jgi:hypothetical protein
MRKIEQEMIAAINERRSWKKDNTEVIVNASKYIDNYEVEICVLLYDNIIATIIPDSEITISDCGWQTVTTKSRLNVLLSEYTKGGFCIYPRGVGLKKAWILYSVDERNHLTIVENTPITIPIN